MTEDSELALRQGINAAMSLSGDQQWGALYALRAVAFHLESGSYDEVSSALGALSTKKLKG